MPQTQHADSPPKDANATVYDLDPEHSLAEFSVKHLMITTVKGRFKGLEGAIVWDDADPAGSRVEASIDASTVDTGTGDRDDHLRSKDFFHVENHPHLTFVSKRVEPTGDDTARVVGDLTIRGVTREVTLDATIAGRAKDPWGNQRIGFSGETTLNRKDFGLNWNQALEAGGWLVGDKVKVGLQVSAIERGDAAKAEAAEAAA